MRAHPSGLLARLFSALLRMTALGFLGAGALHLTLGLGADALLGAQVPYEARTDPGLDSQNRFYGVAFTLYAFVLVLTASDLPRYERIFRWTQWVFFAAGMSRLISVFLYGWPPPAICVLFASELLLPPLLLLWLSKLQRA